MITKQFIDHEDDNILKIYFENKGTSANIHVLKNWYINAGAVYLCDQDDTNNPVLVMEKHKF